MTIICLDTILPPEPAPLIPVKTIVPPEPVWEVYEGNLSGVSIVCYPFLDLGPTPRPDGLECSFTRDCYETWECRGLRGAACRCNHGKCVTVVMSTFLSCEGSFYKYSCLSIRPSVCPSIHPLKESKLQIEQE